RFQNILHPESFEHGKHHSKKRDEREQRRISQAHRLEIQHIVAISRIGDDGCPIEGVSKPGKGPIHKRPTTFTLVLVLFYRSSMPEQCGSHADAVVGIRTGSPATGDWTRFL